MYSIIRPRGIRAIVLLALLIMMTSTVQAQEIRRDGQVWAPEVEELLERLERGEPIGTFVLRAFRPDYASEETGQIVQNTYDRYSDQERLELLDGLERALRGEADWADDLAKVRTQRHASAVLRGLAYDERAVEPEQWDIPGRLVRVYREADDHTARGRALFSLARLLAHEPPQAAEIRDLLRRAARGDGGLDQTTVLGNLLQACEDGMVILREIHSEGLIEDGIDQVRITRVLEEATSREAMEERRRGPCPEG